MCLFMYDYSFCCCLVAESCPSVCNPMDYSPLGSSVHGISQARLLEYVAISYSVGSSWPRDQTYICIGKWILYLWATREAQLFIYLNNILGSQKGGLTGFKFLSLWVTVILCLLWSYSAKEFFLFFCFTLSLQQALCIYSIEGITLCFPVSPTNTLFFFLINGAKLVVVEMGILLVQL